LDKDEEEEFIFVRWCVCEVLVTLGLVSDLLPLDFLSFYTPRDIASRSDIASSPELSSVDAVPQRADQFRTPDVGGATFI
jgi:hypothetical protein